HPVRVELRRGAGEQSPGHQRDDPSRRRAQALGRLGKWPREHRHLLRYAVDHHGQERADDEADDAATDDEQGVGHVGVSALAAADMTANGAASPVQSVNASAAWCTSIPRPPAWGTPRAAAASSKGVGDGWYTVSYTNWLGCSASTATGGGSPAIPIG